MANEKVSADEKRAAERREENREAGKREAERRDAEKREVSAPESKREMGPTALMGAQTPIQKGDDVDVATKVRDEREPRHQPSPVVEEEIENSPNLGDLEQLMQDRATETTEAEPVPAGERLGGAGQVTDDGKGVLNFPNGDTVVVGPSGFRV